MQIVSIDETKWAVGFWWQPLTLSPRKQIRELNRQGADVDDTHPEVESIFGYNVFVPLKKLKQIGVSKVQDVKSAVNTQSLAGALARLYGRNSNILAFFKFEDNNSWLFAIKDGQILPGGDLYGKTAGVMEQYKRFSQSDIWTQVIETGDFEETREKILECLEALDEKIPEVRPVSRVIILKQIPSVVKRHPKTVISITIIVALIFGIIGVKQHKSKQIRLAERLELMKKKRELIRKQREMRKNAKTLKEIQMKLFKEVWEREPEPALVVHSCYDAVRKEVYEVQGWRLEGILCTPEKIQVTRKRVPWASFTNLPDNVEFRINSPNTAVKTKQQRLDDRPDRELIDRETISANLYELARQMGSPVKLTWQRLDPREVSEKERKRNKDLPKMVFSPYWTGSFHLKMVPEYYIRNIGVLNNFPGLVVDSVEKDKSWSIKGDVYAKH